MASILLWYYQLFDKLLRAKVKVKFPELVSFIKKEYKHNRDNNI